MSIARVYSTHTSLIESSIVTIEVDLSKGLHAFSVVGMVAKSVDESKDRVSSAIKNIGFTSPKQKNQKVVVSLAPADIKKEGTLFDVPIAIAYLLATGDIETSVEHRVFIGELSLDGTIREAKGVLPAVLYAKQKGFSEIFIPYENKDEVSSIEGITIYPVHTLLEILGHIDTKKHDETSVVIHKKIKPLALTHTSHTHTFDIHFSDIQGQDTAKRALHIALAGGHNIVLFGPPGTGKTMLAKACLSVLPPLSFDESLEVTSIYSTYDRTTALITIPPFRSPHHTASYVSIIGGGSPPQPGEVTRAHRGILFLDELPEFDTKVIESLREPLEEGSIRISRAKGSVRFPAQCTLIGTMNPCPCGFFGVKGKECTCQPVHIAKYKKKLSGPILDRIDMWVDVSTVDHNTLLNTVHDREDQTSHIKTSIEDARRRQKERYKDTSYTKNSEISSKDINHHMNINKESLDILNTYAKKLDISARSYHRIIKVARSIADMDASLDIKPNHMLEALQYRQKVYA